MNIHENKKNKDLNLSTIEIRHTTLEDLDFCCHLYDDAIAYQIQKGYPQYRWDDRAVQKKCIENSSHYKVMYQGQMAGMFNLQYADKRIWRERDIDDAIYLHGLLIHSDYKGLGIFQTVLDWVITHTLAKNRKYIRLDTWDDNPPLTNYYERYGFKPIESFQIPATDDLPLNCRGNKVLLMEYTV